MFDSPSEKRRLRIASAILTAVAKLGYRSRGDQVGLKFYAVGSQTISLTLEYAKSRSVSSRAKKDDASENPKLVVSVAKERAQWRDSDANQGWLTAQDKRAYKNREKCVVRHPSQAIRILISLKPCIMSANTTSPLSRLIAIMESLA